MTNHEWLANMLPAVVDYYQKKKNAWNKEGLSNDQQLKSAHQINTLMMMIRFAFENNRTNDLSPVLKGYAQRHLKTPTDQVRVLGGVEHLLNQGDIALQKICGWFESYPEVYEEKFALNKSGLKWDKFRRLFKKDSGVPEASFMPFAKGLNPALVGHSQVWEKVLATDEWQIISTSKVYQNWTSQTKVGQKYAHHKKMCQKALGDLLLEAQRYLGLEEKVHKIQNQGR